jgi:hypothetical protein
MQVAWGQLQKWITKSHILNSKQKSYVSMAQDGGWGCLLAAIGTHPLVPVTTVDITQPYQTVPVSAK